MHGLPLPFRKLSIMDLKQLIAHAKEYGFVYPSSDIYDGLSAVYDYGPNGVELKQNIKKYWWRAMVQLNEHIVGLDSAIFMHPKIWKASGHVDAFNDPMIDNKTSKKRYRADVLVEDYVAKIEQKIEKEVSKAQKRFGDDFDETKFRAESPRLLANREKIDEINARLKSAMDAADLDGMRQLIVDLEISDPVSGSKDWTDVRQFNLMFSTQLGNIAGEESELYLRPETAQGIFVNFNNVMKTNRMKIPFGIAQIGKAFRNEIVARQFIFRMREFEQMEMQFFVQPGKELEWYEYWKNARMDWHRSLGTDLNKLKFHDHLNLAHYANAAADIEYEFPFGFKELEGIHSRTDFDLAAHESLSGKNIKYFDPELDESYVPYVIETSIGLDRMFLCMLSESLQEEEITDDEGKTSTRMLMKLPFAMAPQKCAVFPLLKNKPELVDMARGMFDLLKQDFNCVYDEKDAIGRRYRRQDAIGTPFCVTVDFDSLENGTVTLRNRDSLQQQRCTIEEARTIIAQACQWPD